MISLHDQKKIKTDVKLLKKKFSFLEEYYLRLIYQFCEFQVDRAYKVLTVLQGRSAPLGFIKQLLDNPQRSQLAIQELEHAYKIKQYQMDKEMIQHIYSDNDMDEENQTQMIHESQIYEKDFFEQIPSDVCLKIMSYLDPISFSKLCCTNSHFYRYGMSQLAQEYFRTLCIALFENKQQNLPQNCVFQQVKEYVLGNPLEFGPNYRNAVNNNLRYFVWKMECNSFKVDNKFYKSFGSYRNLFMQCPRIHLNGIYTCKEKYIKLGEKNYMTHTTPIHIVYYYRHLRFFEDGSLLYYVSSRKLSNSKLQKILSKENRQNFDPNNQEGLMIGQYISFKDTVHIKSVKSNSIFSYVVRIVSNDHKICDALTVQRYTLQVIDENQMIQVLYEAKPNKQELNFFYSIQPEFMEENQGRKFLCDV